MEAGRVPRQQADLVAANPGVPDRDVPAADEDAGITPPRQTDLGFDGVMVCGELVDEIVPDEGCDCPGCTMSYRVAGTRK